MRIGCCARGCLQWYTAFRIAALELTRFPFSRRRLQFAQCAPLRDLLLLRVLPRGCSFKLVNHARVHTNSHTCTRSHTRKHPQPRRHARTHALTLARARRSCFWCNNVSTPLEVTNFFSNPATNTFGFAGYSDSESKDNEEGEKKRRKRRSGVKQRRERALEVTNFFSTCCRHVLWLVGYSDLGRRRRSKREGRQRKKKGGV